MIHVKYAHLQNIASICKQCTACLRPGLEVKTTIFLMDWNFYNKLSPFCFFKWLLYEWLYSYPTIDQISFLRFLPCFLYWLDTDLTNVGTQLVKFDVVLVAKNQRLFLLMLIVLLVFLNIHTQNISLSYDVHKFYCF